VIVVPAGAASRFAHGRPAPGPVICGIDWSVGSGAARVVAEGLARQLGLAVAPIYVDQIGPWTNELRGVQVEVGDPAEVLAHAAERDRAPLIVVGMRRRVTLTPSVGRDLAAMATVPVLIVPPDGRLPRYGRPSPAWQSSSGCARSGGVLRGQRVGRDNHHDSVRLVEDGV
jgi:nucleotide-binding universal stress UspA family protein